MFEHLLADVIALKLNQLIKNDDLNFNEIIQCYDLECLFSIYSDLQQQKLMVEQNVQTQLVLDKLFIELMNA